MKTGANTKPAGYYDGSDEEDDDFGGSIPAAGASPLFEAIKNHIRQQYEPTKDYIEALKLTTAELHSRLTMLYPSVDPAPDILVEWLYSKGYTFYDEGGMKFVWLFGRV